jgi:spermidine synthase
LGLAIGAYSTATAFPGDRSIPVSQLIKLLLSCAVILVILFPLWPRIPFQFIRWSGYIDNFFAGEILRWGLTLLVLLPPAMILGMVYPTLFRLDIFPENEKGTAAGQLGAINSLGCILGSIFCGFWLIPHFGSETTLKLLIIFLAICALGLGSYVQWKARIYSTLIFLAIVVVVPQLSWNRLYLTAGTHVYFYGGSVDEKTSLLYFHEDTLGGITTVTEDHKPEGVVRTLLTNGKFQGNDQCEREAQIGFALVPMMFTADLNDALVIGLGTGQSAQVVQGMGFRRVDIAEIVPGIVDAASHFFKHINGGVIDQPNVRLLLEDGRNVMLLNDKKYDLMTMELSSVWFAGVTNLYSREFYALAKRHLKPGGIFQQWIQIHHIGTDELLCVINTLRAVFPHVSFWVVGNQGILVGSDAEQPIQGEFLQALESNCTALGWQKATLPSRFRDIIASRLLAPPDTSQIAKSLSSVNTDRNRYMEYATPRYNVDRVDHFRENLLALAQRATFPAPQFAAGSTGILREAAQAVQKADYLRALRLPASP